MAKLRFKSTGFTLIELLVVIAVISILAAILMPVFAAAREKGRQAGCISNEHQIGLAFTLYTEDYDEALPDGVNYVESAGTGWGPPSDLEIWPGEGWAGQLEPYLKSVDIFRCPDDPTVGTPPVNSVVSLGYNINLAGTDDAPMMLGQVESPSKSVELFEVSGVTANVSDPGEGAEAGGVQGADLSASANGLDNRLYAQKTPVTLNDNTYATGYLGGRIPPDLHQTQFTYQFGRHSAGSNFLLADGHVKWLIGDKVSSGLEPQSDTCNESDLPHVDGCNGAFIAAGSNSGTRYAATFSSL